ncbi:precorrin-3B synthase [Streptomyces sp. AN091965]|uniref:precorrin-3B synthase n=1 Tax=Streptomyces sp. AN091965 TaxID=2927803 RepID=UPI001F625C7B|nr:precorrin-3B synthase [Streptomyces sp. AN091965]MCI3932060.1 precorrin-3B synthase [Streptomyces sp. AN091965]
MLAAMSTAPLRPSPQATAAPRDRGDACPGSLRLHAADDGALARVRLPGGVLTVRQAEALATAARDLGDGDLHLTSRGNVQLRGLADGCGAALAALLGAAGLLPSPGHERVRNVVASPLSGLDGRGAGDVQPWLTALDAALCASEAARGLSGRFLFALDDGRGDVAGLDADVTVRAAAGGRALLGLGTPHPVLSVAAADAPRAALVAAEAFLHRVRESGTKAWRITELPLAPGTLADDVRRRLTAGGVGHEPCTPGGTVPTGGVGHDLRAPEGTAPAGGVGHDLRAPEGTVPTEGVGHDLRAPEGTAPTEGVGHGPRSPRDTGGPPPGVIGSALSVHVPLGRFSGLQWRELTHVAAAAGPGELRLTPWRGAVVPAPGLGPAAAEATLARLSAAGLVTGPGSLWLRVGACVGRPGCAKSRADVRADAASALAAAGRSGLPLYWSGCERRCGHPRGDRVDVVAAPGGGYDLSAVRGGREAPGTSIADPTHLATALAAFPSA